MRSGFLGVAALLAPSLALADGWLVAEVPAALVVSDAQDGIFSPGVMPAIGAYLDREHIAVGARLRAGLLGDGDAPGENLADPGVGGVFTATAAVRLHTRRAWIELAGGAGLTGSDVVPTIEAGIGYSMPWGGVEVGPSLRYVRLVSTDTMHAFGTAELALVGLDLRFGKPQPAPRRAYRPIAPMPVVAPVELEVADIPRDGDRVVETVASCLVELDGCPIAEGVTMTTDRIILDDKIFFDLDRARVKTAGRAALAQVAKLWRAHPEWTSIVVEGHADVRGTDDYNMRLSLLRAERVRQVLVDQGAAPDLLTTVGRGRSQPRDTRATEAAHQRNRRVELVIHRTFVDKGSTP